MIAQTACVTGRGDEVAAQRIHLGQRADSAGVAVVIGKLAAGQAGTRCRLDSNEAIISLTTELFAHKGGNETT